MSPYLYHLYDKRTNHHDQSANLLVLSQTNEIFAVDYFDDGDDAYFRSESDGVGFPPPSYNSDLGASCDCKQVLVSSLGEAQHIQPGAN